ncbi:MAG TPA: alpha/beta hydrolase [Pyrinomonadaceae bacterium]|jgi:pimeloyl-ACP methyl ester carboxylesterase|nr:alpha/beta hydrolase [Pyrinomonadaceae bacterium]
MSREPDNAVPGVRHNYAQLDEVRLHYAECGRRGERLVLLLHGFPECWYSWRHQLTALGGERFHVVAPDLRGYNLSDKPARVEDYRMEKLVGDVLGLMDHFGARDAAVVGHDWGAAVAWAVAARHPERVWKVASLQVPPLGVWFANMTVRQAFSSWYMLFFQLPYLPEWQMSANDFAALERMFKKTSRPGTFTDTDLAVYKNALRQKSERTNTTALTAALNYYRANVFANLSRSPGGASQSGRGRIRVPTLFIYGERDFAIVPETVRDVGKYVDAPYRELRLANSNHWVQQESHAEVNAALSSFLES